MVDSEMVVEETLTGGSADLAPVLAYHADILDTQERKKNLIYFLVFSCNLIFFLNNKLNKKEEENP